MENYFLLGLVITAAVLVYFVPTIQAYKAKHKQRSAIFILNFFLGCTGAGWLLAMIWASNNNYEE